jgi:hypothetical protein
MKQHRRLGTRLVNVLLSHSDHQFDDPRARPFSFAAAGFTAAVFVGSQLVDYWAN